MTDGSWGFGGPGAKCIQTEKASVAVDEAPRPGLSSVREKKKPQSRASFTHSLIVVTGGWELKRMTTCSGKKYPQQEGR